MYELIFHQPISTHPRRPHRRHHHLIIHREHMYFVNTFHFSLSLPPFLSISLLFQKHTHDQPYVRICVGDFIAISKLRR